MPGGDGTGPNGQGPMTGRALGFCAGFNAPGFMNPGFARVAGFRRGFGRGLRRGLGLGRGFAWRARFFQQLQPDFAEPAVITESEERQILQEELKALREEMQEIEARLKEIGKKKEK